MQLIDTHAHLYFPEFQGQNPDVLCRFLQQNGAYVLMPNIDVASIAQMIEYHQYNPNHTGMLLGLHPCYVDKDYVQVLTEIYSFLNNYKFKGIGEIGLDLIHESEYITEQKLVFRYQIELAIEHKLPIVIHARRSTKECVQILRDYVSSGLKGVFHCFSDDWQCARDIIDMGFYLGIGGIISFKKSEELRTIVQKVGLTRILLETDSPYLAPVPVRGKVNEPAYLHYIVNILETVLQKDKEIIITTTTKNAQDLFKINLTNF